MNNHSIASGTHKRTSPYNLSPEDRAVHKLLQFSQKLLQFSQKVAQKLLQNSKSC